MFILYFSIVMTKDDLKVSVCDKVVFQPIRVGPLLDTLQEQPIVAQGISLSIWFLVSDNQKRVSKR